MTLYNISMFLKGQASRIMTRLSSHDEVALVLKNGKPLVVVISYERYKRLSDQGIDLLASRGEK